MEAWPPPTNGHPPPLSGHHLQTQCTSTNSTLQLKSSTSSGRVVEMVYSVVMRPPPSSPSTKKNWKLYEPRISE
ncbi:hypothetical protein TB1_004789 [Malus domestica]